MTTFAPLSVPQRTRSDPSKHVNFTYGMVLGVDDFVQEFSYLSGRDRRLARDLIGYGTVSGLKVAYETDYDGPARGPRMSVLPGAAVTPSGQMVCVTSAQCAYLNEWLAAHRTEVDHRLTSPPAPLELYLVLCYAECLMDERPVPGEPCRSDDDLLAPSRVRDDFLLELRFEPPDQREEDAVRKFVAWLRRVPIVDVPTGTIDPDDFVAAIRTSAAEGAELASPPSPPEPEDEGVGPCPPVEHFLESPPPSSLAIPLGERTEFLRAAMHLWVTELLPCWRAALAACGHDCGDGMPPPADSECLLLARLEVPVVHDAVENRLVVGSQSVVVDERRRPFLVDLRVLQEWALTEVHGEPAPSSPPLPSPGPGSPPSPPAPATEPRVVAAGRFDEDGAVSGPPFFSFGGLTVTPRAGAPDVLDLDFDDWDPVAPGDYIVSGTALTDLDARSHVVEVLVPENNLAVRIKRVGMGSNNLYGIQIQITRFGG